jgi:hypothetical protein
MGRPEHHSQTQLGEIRLLWEQNAKVLPQISPRFRLLTLLAKSIRVALRYSARENALGGMKEYLFTLVRNQERKIARYNQLEEDDPIELPPYDLSKAENECGVDELELMALEETKARPLLGPLLEASLQHGLYGEVRDVLGAVETWEALLYFSPGAGPKRVLFSFMGKSTGQKEPDLFETCDELLRLDLPAWTCGRNEDSLEEWLKEVPRLTGEPLLFSTLGDLSPIARVALWLQVLSLGHWSGTVMVQPAGFAPA